MTIAALASGLNRGQGMRRRLGPGHVNLEQHRRIGQPRQGQPAQEEDNAVESAKTRNPSVISARAAVIRWSFHLLAR